MPFGQLRPRDVLSLETSKRERGPSLQILFLDLYYYHIKLAESIIARLIFKKLSNFIQKVVAIQRTGMCRRSLF